MEVNCPGTVAFYPDVTVVNVDIIAISGHCVVMVSWRGTGIRIEKKRTIPSHFITQTSFETNSK